MNININIAKRQLIDSFKNIQDLWDIEFYLKDHGLELDKIYPKVVANFLGKDIETVLNGLFYAALDNKVEAKLYFICQKCGEEVYDLKQILQKCPKQAMPRIISRVRSSCTTLYLFYYFE